MCFGEKSFQVQSQGSLFKIEIVEKETGEDNYRDKTDVTPREILYLRSSKTFNEIQHLKGLSEDITFIEIKSLDELYSNISKLNNIYKNDSFETSFSAVENIGNSLTLSEALIKELDNFYTSTKVPSPLYLLHTAILLNFSIPSMNLDFQDMKALQNPNSLLKLVML